MDCIGRDCAGQDCTGLDCTGSLFSTVLGFCAEVVTYDRIHSAEGNEFLAIIVLISRRDAPFDFPLVVALEILAGDFVSGYLLQRDASRRRTIDQNKVTLRH